MVISLPVGVQMYVWWWSRYLGRILIKITYFYLKVSPLQHLSASPSALYVYEYFLSRLYMWPSIRLTMLWLSVAKYTKSVSFGMLQIFISFPLLILKEIFCPLNYIMGCFRNYNFIYLYHTIHEIIYLTL